MKKHLLILPLTLLWCAAPAADVIIVSSTPDTVNSVQDIAATTNAENCFINWSSGTAQIALDITNCDNQPGAGITGTMTVGQSCDMPSAEDGIPIGPEISRLFTLGNACSTPSPSPLQSWCNSIKSQAPVKSAIYAMPSSGHAKCTITLA